MRQRSWGSALILVLALLFPRSQVWASSPSISSLSPTSGAVGASVTITGTNFGSSQGSSTVKFNGTAATVTSWGSTSIVAKVPSGATTGNVVVTVSGVASNGKSFTVVSAPSITTLSPPSGPVGASITVTGTNFGSSQGSGTVKFNGTTGTPTNWNSTTIHVPVPSGATTGNVVVHASGVDSNGKSFTVLPTPTITSLSVPSGMIGDPVTITGTNFGSSQGSSTVTFNGTAATATSWGTTSIATNVPAGASSGNIVVTVSGVASAGMSFTVYVTPSISSLSPTSGAVGASVTINGTSFQASQGSSTVTFNGVAATPTNWGNTQIKAPVPAGATTGGVVVTVDGLASNAVSFTVKPTPTIISASPMSGAAGVVVTIKGTNFGSSQGSSTVKFNGTSTTASSWSATQILVPVPSGATTGNLVVHTSGVDVSAGTFRIVTIHSVAVSPANLNLPLYSVQRFLAIATNSDQTTEDISASVSWSSSVTTVGTTSSTGILTSVAQGQTTIQATFASFNSSTTLTIQGRSFVPVANLIQARQEQTATLLPSGQVLLAGGYGGSAGSGNYNTLASAEIYDPASKSVSGTGWLLTPRSSHTATLLPNGKVLMAGGVTPIGSGFYGDTATAELYDPTARTFTSTGNLNTARDGHAAVLLPNGTVFVVGGYLYDDGDLRGAASAEIYDPSTGHFTPTGSLSVGRAGCTATLLSSGKVLVAGGADAFSIWSTSEIYDPSTGQFSPGPNLPTPEYGHSATLLSNGTVMLAGGTTTWLGSPQSTVLIYDPNANVFSTIQSMAVARDSQTTTTLNDGTTLIIGGDVSSNDYNTAELFEPSSLSFLAAGATVHTVEGCEGCTSTPGIVLHSATLLSDGTVLVAGGNLADSTVELYETGLRVPVSLQITPGSASMTDGGNQQFVVKDDLGNQRSDATWTISDPTVASLQSPTQPNVTAVKPGQVTLTADVDGVEAQAQITVAPVSLQVTPSAATMVIGGARQFTVVDERGRPSNIATWTVSDSSIATITSGSSPTLTADAAGTATLTATVVGVSAQGQVTVSGLGTLLPGTALWAAPSTSGYLPVQVAHAMPSDTGPGLYSIQTSSDGTQSVVQALSIDGQEIWQTTLPALNGNSVPDGFGGLFATESCTSTNPMTILDLDPATGTPLWELPFPTVFNGQMVCFPGQPKMAVRQDGGVAVSMPLQISPRIFVLDGSSGGMVANPSIPASSLTDQFGDVSTCDCYSPVSQPIVDSDGSIYVEYEVRQIPYPPTTISSTLSLLQIAQDGTTNTTQLSSSNNANLFPGNLIPDGNGGVLATWTIVPIDGSMPPNPYQAAYVVSGSVSSTYPLPFTPARFVTGTDGFPVRPSVVLGENGLAFATDGTSSGDSTDPSLGPKVASLNLTNGAVNWSHQLGTQSLISLVAATSDGGVTITDGSNISQLNSQGAATTVAAQFNQLGISWEGGWYGVASGQVSEISLPSIRWATSFAAMVGGNPSGSAMFIGVAAPVEGVNVFGPAVNRPSCSLPTDQAQREKVALTGDALTKYNDEKQGLLNSGFLTCPSCSTFFNADPTRATYFGQLTSAVTRQVPYDGAQTNISQYDAGMSDGKNPTDVRIKKIIPVCAIFVPFHGPHGTVQPRGVAAAASQIMPPQGGSATDTYINPDSKALATLTQGTILHETLHNLTGLEDFVQGDWRTSYGFQPPYDLKTLLGIETTPGVDPDPAGSTIDITNVLQQNQCAAQN